MNTAEIELLVALFAIYAYECIYWINTNEEAYTRSDRSAWKKHRPSSLSFTLLGRMPILVNPLLLRSGFLKRRDGNLPSEEELAKLSIYLDKFIFVDQVCRLQLFLLLVFIPWMTWNHKLESLWPYVTVTLLASHTCLISSLIFMLRNKPFRSVFSLVAPLLFNPLGATRALDVLSEFHFETEDLQKG